jgi:hypothetical protein
MFIVRDIIYKGRLYCSEASLNVNFAHFGLFLFIFLKKDKDTSEVELKRKFLFSYFREFFAKICFLFLRKKLTKSYENNESFREKITREAKMS